MCGVGAEDQRPSKQACLATNRRAMESARGQRRQVAPCALISVAQSGGQPQQCASVAPARLGHQPYKTPRDRPMVGYILSTTQCYWPLGQWPPQTRPRAYERLNPSNRSSPPSTQVNFGSCWLFTLQQARQPPSYFGDEPRSQDQQTRATSSPRLRVLARLGRPACFRVGRQCCHRLLRPCQRRGSSL
jgi:hypothetical protein